VVSNQPGRIRVDGTPQVHYDREDNNTRALAGEVHSSQTLYKKLWIHDDAAMSITDVAFFFAIVGYVLCL
jgi:hypothetical protein